MRIEASGRITRSTEECEMSRSCHRATSSSAGREVPPEDPRQPRQPLGGDRVALVRHGRRALLARLEPLLRLPHLGALEVAELGGEGLDAGADGGAGVEVLGVAVAGHHLGGRHRLQAQGGADVALDGGVDVRPRAHGARQLAGGDGVTGGPQPLPVPAGLQGPQRHLGAEGGRLGVHAVGAPHHGRVAVGSGRWCAAPRSGRPGPPRSTSADAARVAPWAVSTTSEEVRP